MTVLGLCGQSGAGKTTALETLVSLGAVVCDCDVVSRLVMSRGTDCTAEVVESFGNEILRDDGEIDRKALGKIVFFDREKLERLTEITHRYIKAEVRERIRKAEAEGEGLFVVDAPLLFESGLDKDCHVTLAIVSDREKRLERIMARDGIDRELAEKRLASQIDEDELYRLSDEVIVNDGTVEELAKAIKAFAERRGLLN
ncbi:MAG: dephospho-CoA kinase [Clostridia bacterium]|nr:dephospho-CoA kinase [Clostridia bacterium]